MITFPITDYEPVKWPPRCRLYHLEPIGIGTPQVESMTSYVSRIAAAHRLSTSIFVQRELACHLSGMPDFREREPCQLLRYIGGSFNGVSPTATEVVQIMQEATGWSDLLPLTMARWAGILSSHDLLRRYQAWCPQCIESWRECGIPMYEPLIWKINAVTICSVHQSRLIDKCPHCFRQARARSWTSTPGYCSLCRTFLGVRHKSTAIQPERRADWELFASQATAEMLTKASHLEKNPCLETFAGNIRHLVKQCAEGKMYRFGKLVHVGNTTVDMWMKGTQVPQLLRILLVSYRLGVPVVRLILEPLSVHEAIRIRAGSAPIAEQLIRPLRRNNFAKIQAFLERIQSSPKNPPLSLADVARQIGCHQSHLGRKFPDLCRNIIERHKTYRKQKSNQYRSRIKAELSAAISSLHSSGVFPGKSKVSAQLTNPHWIILGWVRAEYRKMLADLGLADSASAPSRSQSNSL